MRIGDSLIPQHLWNSLRVNHDSARSTVRFLVFCCALFASVPLSSGEEAPALSEEECSSLLALASANKGEFDRAQKLAAQILRIEQSIFGDAHKELLGTLDIQASVAVAELHTALRVRYACRRQNPEWSAGGRSSRRRCG